MQQAIGAHIDQRQQEMIDLLRQVVDIYAPSSDAAGVTRVGDIFAWSLRRLGFTVRRVEVPTFGAHVVADLSFDRPGPRVFLMGHMDTVEYSGDVTTRRLAISGDIAKGLGALDMKGGIVSMIYGLAALLRAGEKLSGSIRVVINSDEEPGSPSSRPLLPELLKGVTAGLICEGGRPGGALVVERKGCGIWKFKVTGKAAHAGAEPEKGASAIRELIEKVRAAEDLKAGPTTLNCGLISGGVAPYVVPDYAEAAIDIRVPNPVECHRIEAGLREIASQTYVLGTSTILEGQFHRPPASPIKGTKALQEMAVKFGKALGMPVTFVPTGGVGDINNIVDAGVPALDGLGPQGLGAHGIDEYIELPTLFSKAKLIALMAGDILMGKYNPE
ncbi:MAG: M20 family metallopeptidase [Bacillota bacterium]|nr:M20 family metallopeptidase [Bacillota bacterium]